MKVKITRVWGGELDDYKKVLDKYKAEYKTKGDIHNEKHYAIIEIKKVEEIFILAKELDTSNGLIVTENEIEIYDDYVE